MVRRSSQLAGQSSNVWEHQDKLKLGVGGGGGGGGLGGSGGGGGRWGGAENADFAEGAPTPLC